MNLTAQSPGVLRCSQTADLLAALPFLSGFHATHSLFLLLFRGNRGSEAMRIDLPQENSAEARRSLVQLVTHLMKTTGAGKRGAAVIIKCDDSFGDRQTVPWQSLAEQLRHLFRRHQWPLRDLAVVAADGWAGLLDRGPFARRALSEIDSSPIVQEASRIAPAPLAFAKLSELPAANERLLRDVHQCLRDEFVASARDIDLSDGSQAFGAEQLLATIDAAVGAAADSTVHLHGDARNIARMIHTAGSPEHWVTIFLALLAHREADLQGGAQAGAPQPRSSQLGQAEPLPALYALLEAVGQTKPRLHVIANAIGTVQFVTAHAPKNHRPPLLGMLAALWWLRGMQSIAQHHIDEALALDTASAIGHTIAQLNCAPPVWCLDAIASDKTEAASEPQGARGV